MIRLLVAAALCVAACAPPPGERAPQSDAHGISVWHDDERDVTCWVYQDGSGYQGYGGISCLPDKEVSR